MRGEFERNPDHPPVVARIPMLLHDAGRRMLSLGLQDVSNLVGQYVAEHRWDVTGKAVDRHFHAVIEHHDVDAFKVLRVCERIRVIAGGRGL